MPIRRFARRTHRDAARLAAGGDHAGAVVQYRAAAAEYRARLADHPGDQASRADFVDLLAARAASHAALDDHARAYAVQRERVQVAAALGPAADESARLRLDLAEAAVRAGRLLTAVCEADTAVSALDEAGPFEPGEPAFSDLAEALARAARVFGRAADPDLAVGAADQAARMLIAADRHGDRLRESLRLAEALHTAAGRAGHARGARSLLDRYFPGAPHLTAPGAVTLRGALEAAAAMGAFTDRSLIGRLCPDPAGRGAAATVTARGDLGLAAVALHAAEPAVDALAAAHPPLAWRIATEVHYFLAAADRDAERNLHLNFRDHGPVWVAMLMALTAGGRRGPIAADLAQALAGLTERLHTRHAAPGYEPLMRATAAFLAANTEHPPR